MSRIGDVDEDADESADDEPDFQLRRDRPPLEEMDLTPMVDVTFLLLIFFMITASFSLQKTIEIPQPDSDKKGAAQSLLTLEDLQDTAIIANIDSRSEIELDEVPVAAGERLIDLLQSKMRREKKTEIIINADGAAQHRVVVRLMDAANGAGLQKIRLVSRASKPKQ